MLSFALTSANEVVREGYRPLGELTMPKLAGVDWQVFCVDTIHTDHIDCAPVGSVDANRARTNGDDTR